jgi:hypothetical protein
MSSTVRVGIPVDEAMRTEHAETVVRPTPNFHESYDPADPSDHGPHVDRVGIVAVDDFELDDDDRPPVHHAVPLQRTGARD